MWGKPNKDEYMEGFPEQEKMPKKVEVDESEEEGKTFSEKLDEKYGKVSYEDEDEEMPESVEEYLKQEIAKKKIKKHIKIETETTTTSDWTPTPTNKYIIKIIPLIITLGVGYLVFTQIWAAFSANTIVETVNGTTTTIEQSMGPIYSSMISWVPFIMIPIVFIFAYTWVMKAI